MEKAEKLRICLSNYEKWKKLAMQARSLEDAKKFMKRAFFWIELQSAFSFLENVERINDESVRKKIILAKSNLIKKLSDYAKQLLDEF